MRNLKRQLLSVPFGKLNGLHHENLGAAGWNSRGEHTWGGKQSVAKTQEPCQKPQSVGLKYSNKP